MTKRGRIFFVRTCRGAPCGCPRDAGHNICFPCRTVVGAPCGCPNDAGQKSVFMPNLCKGPLQVPSRCWAPCQIYVKAPCGCPNDAGHNICFPLPNPQWAPARGAPTGFEHSSVVMDSPESLERVAQNPIPSIPIPFVIPAKRGT